MQHTTRLLLSTNRAKNLSNQTTTIIKRKYVDKITNFNPSTDALEINTDSFSINGSATFESGKNKREVKKILAKQNIDFLYDEKIARSTSMRMGQTKTV